MPIVLFGRTGAVQDAWIILEEKNVKQAILEIGFYPQPDAIEFAFARVQEAKPESPHKQVERDAIELLITKLHEQTQSDGDRFAGYAPVLQAVAQRVAREDNPSALIAQVKSGAQPVTLQTVVSEIMVRERNKLGQLKFEDPSISEKLYRQSEQLERLVARLYGAASPNFPAMSPTDVSDLF